jgi:dolichyl-phosphate beta-glucosyltransferase
MGDQPLISLIIPAYQEEKRIGQTIGSWSAYLERHHPGTEVIVVCDGCTDRTAEVVRRAFFATGCTLEVIELAKNEGKGYAVRAGMREAAGEYLFFTDADLSYQPETMDELLRRLRDGADVVIAQRREKKTCQGLGRRILGVVSGFLVGYLLSGIRDSQAGHKAFTRQAGKDLFSRLRTRRFLFDLEILVMAQRQKYRIEKVLVDWEDRPGSTVRVVVDSLRSLRDLLLIYSADNGPVKRLRTGQPNFEDTRRAR